MVVQTIVDLNVEFHSTHDTDLGIRVKESIKRDKQPTYIESSKNSWDEIRHNIEARFKEGMSCRTANIGMWMLLLHLVEDGITGEICLSSLEN